MPRLTPLLLILPVGVSGCLLTTYPYQEDQPLVQVVFDNPEPTTLDDLNARVVLNDDRLEMEVEGVRWQIDGEDAALEGDLTVPADRTARGQIWTALVDVAGIDEGLRRVEGSVTVVNAPPVVTTADIGPASPGVADPITVTAEATDPDGDEVVLEVAFIVEGTEVQRGTDPTLTAPRFAAGDVVSATVLPRDDEGFGAALDAGTVTVKNAAPTISGLELLPATPAVTDVLQATATVDDSDGDPLDVVYAFSVNGTEVQRGEGSTLAAPAFRKGDTVIVAMTATDPSAAQAEATSAPVTVRNTPPALDALAIAPAEARVEDVLTAESTVTDADGDDVSLTYVWTVDGVEAQRGPTPTLSAPAFAKGQSVGLVAEPFDGEESGDALSATPVDILNSAPVVSAVTLSPSSPTVTDVVTATATARDADGDTMALTYDFQVDGITEQEGASNTLSAPLFAKDQNIQVDVTPDDGTLRGTTVSSPTVRSVNAAPVVTDVSLSPASPTVTDVITASATDTDADGDTVALTYDFRVEGSSVQEGPSNTLSAPLFAKNQDIDVEITPNDGSVDGVPVASAAVRSVNTAPVVTDVSLSPASPTVTDVITASATDTDADGDTVTLTYDFRVEGTSVQEGASNTLSAPLFAKNQDIDVEVTPNDGSVDGVPVASAAVRSVNTAPVVTDVSLSPASPTVTDVITASATDTDADGDTVALTYDFRVGGTSVQEGASNTLSAPLFAKNQDIDVEVTPNDGSVDGVPVVSAAVRSVNTPPAVTDVSLSPASPTVTDVITASATDTDADGDTVALTYDFRVEGTSVQEGASNTLSAPLFAKNQDIDVEVTPNDGSVDGVPVVSATVRSVNAAPVVTDVSLSPASPTVTDVITASATDTDADGDTVTLTYDFRVEGTSVQEGASNTLSAPLFAKNQDIDVEVTPNDGSVDGVPVASAAVRSVNTAPVVTDVSLSPRLAHGHRRHHGLGHRYRCRRRYGRVDLRLPGGGHVGAGGRLQHPLRPPVCQKPGHRRGGHAQRWLRRRRAGRLRRGAVGEHGADGACGDDQPGGPAGGRRPGV